MIRASLRLASFEKLKSNLLKKAIVVSIISVLVLFFVDYSIPIYMPH